MFRPLFLFALAMATPAIAEPGVQTFGSWIAGCDNENICTAIRPAWDAVDGDGLPGSVGTPFLQIRHHPHRDAVAQFRLFDPAYPAPLAVLKPPLVWIVFRFNNNIGVGNSLIYRAAIDGEVGYRFQDEDARSILYGLQHGLQANVSIANTRKFSFDPAPFGEVLEFFDKQQDLAGTPGALVLRPGNVMYDYAHPVPPEADTVQLTTFTPRQLGNWTAEYPEDLPGETVRIEAEPARGLVTIFRFKSPDRDCGLLERWGHVGKANEFVLVERREMPICNGIGIADWIRTFRANAVSP